MPPNILLSRGWVGRMIGILIQVGRHGFIQIPGIIERNRKGFSIAKGLVWSAYDARRLHSFICRLTCVPHSPRPGPSRRFEEQLREAWR